MPKKMIIKAAMSVFLSLSIAPQAMATSSLSSALEAAKSRSDLDQSQLKKRMVRKLRVQENSWSQRESVAIEIQRSHSPSYSLDSEINFENKESGEDRSGLDRLRSNVEEESTDIDFDAELREVSMNESQ